MEKYYNKRIIRDFGRKKLLESCQSRIQQIVIFSKHMTDNYSISLCNKDLANIFGVQPFTVTKALQKPAEEQIIGRPSKLDGLQEQSVVQYIVSSTESGDPKTQKEI